MMKLGLASLCIAVLTLTACTQASTDPTKSSADKPVTVQPTPQPYPYLNSGDHGNDGGGGGY
jgi:hypothetical protein